ncbi:MAG: glycoside hydrolase family 3 N-terminal domain-containing protein [Simkaniaceae bacterium]|nr:glycoside hydrolase family 3 N-terminal domain-containing protein [Candidatus Sacchlamyda saccharinae]
MEKLFILPKPLKNREIGGLISVKLQAADNQLLVVDAEWGMGMRIEEVPDLPKNGALGAIEDMEVLETHGREIARQCRERGIQSALAPVVDVNSNPDNPVIGDRSFGNDPEEVAKRGLAVMRGMQQGGIWACAKHFPGHGDTHIDSHLSLPVIDKSVEEMRACEWVPFQALIDAGVDMVMVGHLLFPELDSLPSSLSPRIVTGILREEMGFEGVIITDSLSMGALSGLYDPDEIAERALLAGADLLLYNGCTDEWLQEWIPKAIERITRNVSEEVIDDRLARIERLKLAKYPL